MAKQIKSPIPDSIFDRAIAGAVELLAKIKDIVAEFRQVGTAAKKSLNEIDFGKSEGVKQLTDQIAKLEKQVESLQKTKKQEVDIEKELEKIRKEEEKQKKKLTGLTDDQVKAKLKLQAANKKQRDELKALLVLEDKQIGTLGKLNAANTALRLERAKLNAEIPEQRQRFDELNAEIDANVEKIGELSDKQKKGKESVGQYAAGIDEAISSSGALSSVTSELSEAQAILSTLTKLVTSTLKKNEDQTDDNAKATTRLGRTTQRAGRILKSSLIGLVAVAAGAVGKFITGTQEGQIKFQSFTAQVIGGLNVVTGRFIDFGKAVSLLFTGEFKKAGKAFEEAFRSGLVDDIKSVNAAVSQLVKTQFLAGNAARAVSAEIERRLKLEEELREVADDDTRGFRERQKAAAELTRIFLTGQSALSQQSNLLKDQLEIARERTLISIQERAGGKIDTEALRGQITASRELSEVVLANKELLGENNALIIDTTVLDALIEAEKAFLQKETELNSQRLTDRQKIAKLLFDEVEQEVDFLIDATAQVVASNNKIVSSDKETFVERRKVLADTVKLVKDANTAVLDEIARTIEGVEGSDFAAAFASAVSVSDLNTKLKDLGSAEIPINRLLELFKEIKTQERDFKDVAEILDEALTGGREAGDRIKILKESNVEIAAFADRLLALSRVDVSALSGESLDAFNEKLATFNDDVTAAQEGRNRKLVELEIEQLEERLDLAKEGSAQFLEIEEALLNKRLEFLNIQRSETLDAIDEEDQARADAAKNEEERQKRLVKQRTDALEFLGNAIAANAEKRQTGLDKQIESAKNRQDEIQQAIIAGNEGARESLNKARREEEEAALKREQSIERQKKQEALLTTLKLLAKYAGTDVANPVARAAQDLTAANAFAEAFFFDGAERVDQDGQLKPAHRGRDGYRVAVDGSERIMTGKQNSKTGNLSNEILAEVGFLYRTGALVKKGGTGGGSQASVEELRQVNKHLKALPKLMPVANVDKDLITGIVSEVLQRGNTRTKGPVSW